MLTAPSDNPEKESRGVEKLVVVHLLSSVVASVRNSVNDSDLLSQNVVL